MTSKDPTISADESKISQLYQTGATDLPSPLLDQQILQQAKDALPKLERSSNPVKHRRLQTWRKWQWSSSIAASIVLVSLLFVFNQSYYQTTDLAVDRPYNESDVLAKKQREEAARTRVLQTKQQAQEAEYDRQNNSNIVGSTNADHVRNETARELLMSEQFSSIPQQKKESRNSPEFMDGQALPAPEQNKPLQDKSAIADNTANNDIANPTIDFRFLDSLLDELLSHQQSRDAKQNKQAVRNTLSDDFKGEQAENQNSASVQKIQIQLYEILLAYKQKDPKLLVPQKYLNVLSQEQVVELETVSTTQSTGPTTQSAKPTTQ